MILIDRVNALAPGWSHVLSDTNDLAELDAFRARVGAPRQAFHLRGRRPHLDLRDAPRELALQQPDVLVFERTSDMLRYMQARGNGAEARGEAPGTRSERQEARGEGVA